MVLLDIREAQQKIKLILQSQCLCRDNELLFALGIHRDRRIMRSLMDDWKFRNPPQAEILKQLRERYKWEKRKGNILKSMAK
eukprot:gene5084-3632_t